MNAYIGHRIFYNAMHNRCISYATHSNELVVWNWNEYDDKMNMKGVT